MQIRFLAAVSLSLSALTTSIGVGNAQDATDLAKQTQNPIANLVSVPFQNNFNTGVGLHDDLQWIMNVQPVIPTPLNEEWNLINRFILPVIDQPEMIPGTGREFGLGDLQYQGFLSPLDSGDLTWGIGPVIQFPTATSSLLGAQEWGLGPGFVALTMPGNWVIGGLVNNVWSLGSDDVNLGLFQYFVNYNFDGGWYLTSAPINTINWNGGSGDKWTVPLGLGVGKVHNFGTQPVNISAQAYYNVVHPDAGADWQFRFQVQFLFPKKG